jgi:hypothetical protein
MRYAKHVAGDALLRNFDRYTWTEGHLADVGVVRKNIEVDITNLRTFGEWTGLGYESDLDMDLICV